MAIPHPITAEELARMGEQDFDFELVSGKLVPVTPGGGQHGALAMWLGARVLAFVEARALGRVYAAETGYVLRRDPDTVRAPDVSFVSRHRPAGMRSPRGFIPGAPDLAVEVRSPDDTIAALEAKARDYLRAGARLVWIVDPQARQIRVHTGGRLVEVRSEADVLDGAEVLPGFTLDVALVFAQGE
jgi:Uma2 family endonuclease